MPYSQTFPNGQTLNSTAIDDQEMTDIMQQATCFCLGLMNNQPYSVTLTEGDNTVVVDDLTGIAVYFKVSDTPGFGLVLYGEGGYGLGGALPPKTIITGIDQSTGTLTLNNAALSSGPTTIFITNPLAGRLVRQEWPTKGAPSQEKADNVAFVRAVEINDWYNKVPDQGAGDAVDAANVELVKEYTRVWRVSWVFYGPKAYTNATILKSAMQQDFTHDSLAAFNVFLMPEVSSPQRVPEEFEGEWWQRSDFEMVFYEQVNESIATQTVTSVEVQVLDNDGIKLDLEIEG